MCSYREANPWRQLQAEEPAATRWSWRTSFPPFFFPFPLFFSFSNLRLLNSHTSPIKITQSWSNFFCSLERSLNSVLLKLWCLWKIWDQWKLWRCCCLLEFRLLWSELEQELTTVFSIPAKGCSCHQTKLLPYITILTWSKYKYHKAKADVVFFSPTMNVLFTCRLMVLPPNNTIYKKIANIWKELGN